MSDDEYRVEGTNLSYRDWSEKYLELHLEELFLSMDYVGNWTYELAFLNASYHGFTVGYRVLVPSYLGVRLFFEITWTRADELVVMVAYHATDEIRKLVKGFVAPEQRPRNACNNATQRFR